MRRCGLASAARQEPLGDDRCAAEQRRAGCVQTLERADGLEAVLEHERRVPVGKQVHLGDAGAAHGRAHEEEDVVLVGSRDAGHVVRSRRHRVEGVHDTLRTARRTGREEDHPRLVAVGLCPASALPVVGVGEHFEEHDGIVADLGGEAIVFGGGNDDEGGIAKRLEREADVGWATPTVEDDHCCSDSQQGVVADHGVDRVSRRRARRRRSSRHRARPIPQRRGSPARRARRR